MSSAPPPWRPRGSWLLVLVVAAAAAYLLPVELPWASALTKPVPALALAAWAGTRGRSRAAPAVAVGLVLSALGDLLLALPSDQFTAGLFAFLAAHVAYVFGFTREVRALAPARLAPFLLWGGLAYAGLAPGLGGLALAVALYTLAVAAMMWRAAARLGSPGVPRAAAAVGLTGAVLFAASDTLIAAARFRGLLPWAGMPILLLYWAGQLGVAASVVGYDAIRPPTEVLTGPRAR